MNTLVKNINTFHPFFNEFIKESQGLNTLPSANIVEDQDRFKVQIAAPGFKKEDFKIEVTEKQLKISVEKSEETEEKTEKYIRKEFGYNSFTRTFRLPNTVNIDSIEATYENGILELGVPKKEEAKPKEPRLLAVN